ncbi:MAG: HPr family phosphocarrier protein [Methylacidiphilales bacterium]|nr:HPr family phosphocarrier protein [Candidatus Methylacidiphilales bacterium]MDW8349231.1 HPr family phosphocarrier protein [Verrucomicrobiae bacterium]
MTFAIQNLASDKAELHIEIQNKLGLHARPAAMFVRVANRFSSEIIVEKDGEEINGKSIMGLMLLAAGQGSKLKIIATGKDAHEALRALGEIIERKFDEE